MGSLPPDSLLEPGARLDRYELLAMIGKGGMAAVWLARIVGAHGFERLAAIKTILPEHASDEFFRSMFLDEARIAAGIDHPNVARILDVGEQRAVPYIVMEYVPGVSLHRIHREAKNSGQLLPWWIVARVLADTCAGLHAAHELRDPRGSPLGIVHRDVSPQNILVSESGMTKIIDFGVAKAKGRISGETETGVTKGKIRYMAPEQAMGLACDRRADVWSIGVVAYEMLAGTVPYDGPNDVARLQALVTAAPPPPLPDTVPPALRDAIFRALSRNAGDRYVTTTEMRAAFEQALATTGRSCTTDDVAAYVASRLGDRAAERKQIVERALKAAEERGSSPRLAPISLNLPTQVDPRPIEERGVATSGSLVITNGRHAPRSRWRLWAAIAFAACGVLAVGIAGSMRQTPPAAPATSSVDTKPSAPPPSAEPAPSPSAVSSLGVAAASASAATDAGAPAARPPSRRNDRGARPNRPPGTKPEDDSIF